MFQVNETRQDEATEFGQVQQQELGFSGKNNMRNLISLRVS